MALKTLTRMIRLGELSEEATKQAITMATAIINNESSTDRDRVNAGKLILQVQKLSLDAAIEMNKNDRLDQGKVTENIKLYGEVDTSEV